MALDFSVNYLSVLVAAIAGFIVSWLWWGPLFGKKWMKLSGVKPSKDMKKGMGGKMLTAFIAQLVVAGVLSALLSATSALNVLQGIALAFWIWLGFVATIMIGSVLWDGKPMGLFWLNSLGWLVTLIVMAIVLVMM